MIHKQERRDKKEMGYSSFALIDPYKSGFGSIDTKGVIIPKRPEREGGVPRGSDGVLLIKPEFI